MTTRVLWLNILLWYNVLSLGVWVGGTVYQMLVIVPLWSASPPESVRAFFNGTRYMVTIYHFFGPVTQVARFVPLLALAAVGWRYPSHRTWLAIAAGTMLVGLIITRAYVWGINDVLFAKAGGDLPADAIRDMARRWILVDRVRFAIMTSGYLCLLQAFRLPSPS